MVTTFALGLLAGGCYLGWERERRKRSAAEVERDGWKAECLAHRRDADAVLDRAAQLQELLRPDRVSRAIAEVKAAYPWVGPDDDGEPAVLPLPQKRGA